MATFSVKRKGYSNAPDPRAKKIKLRIKYEDRSSSLPDDILVRILPRIKYEDLISSLPDDILVRILSLLKDMREATRTSVLSKKWLHLWYNVPNYDFTAFGFEKQVASKLVSCVNSVVRSSRASTINRFKVHSAVGAQHSHSISEWLNFAMTKSVKELEFNFSADNVPCLLEHQIPPTLTSFGRYAKYPSVHTLVSLTLRTLCLTTDFLESLLFNFTNLECLIMERVFCIESEYKGHHLVHHSYKKNMKTKLVGSLLKLRHLEILSCRGFGEIEISAEKLTSLVYNNAIEDIKFTYVPLLNDITFGSWCGGSLICNFDIISGFSPQLSRLKLATYELKKINQRPLRVPNQFGNLRELDIVLYSCYPTESLLLVTNFIEACPLLHILKLQREYSFGKATSDLERWNWKESRNDVRFDAMKRHHCLNIFEMVGFLGVKVDIELIFLLAQETIPLEKIIVDPNQYYPPDLIELGRIEAKLLRNHIPSRIQMEVL